VDPSIQNLYVSGKATKPSSVTDVLSPKRLSGVGKDNVTRKLPKLYKFHGVKLGNVV